MNYLPLILLTLLLSACGQSEQENPQQALAVDARTVVSSEVTEQQAAKAPSQGITVSPSSQLASSTASSTPATIMAPAAGMAETASSSAVSQRSANDNAANDTLDKSSSKSSPASQSGEPTTLDWDALFPAGFNPQTVMQRYEDQLSAITDNDPQAMSIYQQISEELNNAPVNQTLDGQQIRLPGFMAPLEIKQGRIAEFLLVPYFGACIHSPPPPLNQTVLVKASEGGGIKSENSYEPIWVTGQISIEGQKTDIGNAGYRIENAQIEIYQIPVQ